jgi:hypothetical protein
MEYSFQKRKIASTIGHEILGLFNNVKGYSVHREGSRFQLRFIIDQKNPVTAKAVNAVVAYLYGNFDHLFGG